MFSSTRLPVRGDEWMVIPSPPQTLLPAPLASDLQGVVRDAITIRAPWISRKSPCPVKDANRNEWTALEREKGEDRMVPKDIEELKKMVSVFLFVLSPCLIVLSFRFQIHSQVPSSLGVNEPPAIGEFTKVNPYIGVPSEILEG